MLEIDQALWGSFWQGDVIAPGYLLPALELAYLRATRLDETFTDSNPQSYLQTLQATLTKFPDGVWLTEFGTTPALCALFSRPQKSLALIIWLVAEGIIAGYKDAPANRPGYHLVPIHSPTLPIASFQQKNRESHSLFDCLPEWRTQWPALNHPTQIDILIRLHRSYSHWSHTLTGQTIGDWLTDHT